MNSLISNDWNRSNILKTNPPPPPSRRKLFKSGVWNKEQNNNTKDEKKGMDGEGKYSKDGI